MHLLRKLSSKTYLIRGVVLATSGSGLAYLTSFGDYEKSVSVSIPSSCWGHLNWPRRIFDGNNFYLPPFIHSSVSQTGVLPLFLSRQGAVPDPGTRKGAEVDAGNCPNPSCNCLGRDTIANAAAKVSPAVVNLSVPKSLYGMRVGDGIGSGTIINEDGTILTCAHVVVDSEDWKRSSKGVVEVTLQDGRSFEGIVVNADVHSDIALVKIKSKTPLPAAKVGSSSNLRPGEWVVSMGCPLSLHSTVTAGIVSFVGRKSSDLGLGGIQMEFLQTDCPINKGNSGGPLINMDGEVIGVNRMKVSGADGLNFAVPIDSALKVIQHFRRNGRVVRPWLGMKMLVLNDMIVARLKERYSTFPDVSRGVLVSMVFPGSPADHAGFRPGDVVIEFGGNPVRSTNEIIETMGDGVGKPFKVVVERANNVIETLTVVPEEANPEM